MHASKNFFRTFVAIEVPKNAQQIIKLFIDSLSVHGEFGQVKWVKSKNLHLTVCFLGNITNKQYNSINQNIIKLAKTIAPLTLKLKGLQLFPSTKKPCALVLNIEPNTYLTKLAINFRDKVAAGEIQIDKQKFIPHITIGRLKTPPELKKINLLKVQPPSLSFKVTNIKLFESMARTNDSVYIIIKKYNLKSTKK